MKLKYYLRGAGIGMIIAVLIMVIGGSSRTMSDGEIIRRAQELGMVKAEEGSGTVKDYNNKSSAASEESSQAPSASAPAEPSSASIAASALEQSSTAAASSAVEQSSVAASSADVEQSSAAAPSSAVEQSSAAEPSSSASYSGPEPVDNGTSVTITIPTGMLSDKVAEMIQRAGIISDAKDFNRYLISKGYDRQILKGDCVIKKGASYEEIAKILISKNR